MLEDIIKQTIEDILKFSESLMQECHEDRLPKKYFELGFNLKTAILLAQGKEVNQLNKEVK